MAKAKPRKKQTAPAAAKETDDPSLDDIERPGGGIDHICYRIDNGSYVVKVTGSGASPNAMVQGYFTKDPSTPMPPVVLGNGMADGQGDYEIEFPIGTPPATDYDLDIYIGQANPDTYMDAPWSQVDAC